MSEVSDKNSTENVPTSPVVKSASPPPPGPKEKGQRLMLTKMVLENFKSYYGVHEIGPFHHVCTIAAPSTPSYSAFRAFLRSWVPTGAASRT